MCPRALAGNAYLGKATSLLSGPTGTCEGLADIFYSHAEENLAETPHCSWTLGGGYYPLLQVFSL